MKNNLRRGNKSNNYLFPIILSIFLVFSVSYAPITSASGWTPYSYIKEIQFTPTSIYITLDPNVVTNINGCTNWGGLFQIINGTTTLNDFEEAYVSAALAAKMGNKRVSILSSGCTSVDVNKLDHIQIE